MVDNNFTIKEVKNYMDAKHSNFLTEANMILPNQSMFGGYLMARHPAKAKRILDVINKGINELVYNITSGNDCIVNRVDLVELSNILGHDEDKGIGILVVDLIDFVNHTEASKARMKDILGTDVDTEIA